MWFGTWDNVTHSSSMIKFAMERIKNMGYINTYQYET